MDEDEGQFTVWKNDAANHLLLAAHALTQAFYYDPDGNPEWYQSRIGFLLQEADELRPSGEEWPEYADNVIPLSQYMRPKCP
jgi:hypothetical protein